MTNCCVELIVLGPPATKKNSRVHRFSKKQQRLVPAPSDAYMDFQQRLRAAWLTRRPSERRTLPVRLYNVCAHVYLQVPFAHRRFGDASGYYDAIGDALQAAEVITNDKLIEAWDGSRRYYDPSRPRVEIVIRPLV